MELLPVRIYAHEAPAGLRVLIDRVWPRGISKEKAALDEWDKTVAPSTDLRKWFGHDPEKFAEFTQRYRAELDANPAVADLLAKLKASGAQRVLLLYGAKDTEHNNAVVLRDYLSERLAQ
ncbi:MAG: DUF488 family protein [Lactobacillus sp.]|jgi:uncharacterized protein YeaO (DUF488 family)|nr:DUF488 family protein [Lactobacillus sp.]MCI2032819.1 DUF488 family protein [Lactobacillus sp.]